MIPVEQIARLAELYDRYNNALDPLSDDCKNYSPPSLPSEHDWQIPPSIQDTRNGNTFRCRQVTDQIFPDWNRPQVLPQFWPGSPEEGMLREQLAHCFKGIKEAIRGKRIEFQ